MVSDVLDALIERLRDQWGPYAHPGLTAPDPDCHCEGCVLDALSEEDRTWLEACGWKPSGSGLTIYTYSNPHPVKPCVYLTVGMFRSWTSGMFLPIERSSMTVSVNFYPRTSASDEVSRFCCAVPDLLEKQRDDALDRLGWTVDARETSWTQTLSGGISNVCLTLELSM